MNLNDCKVALIGTGALSLELVESFGIDRFVAAYTDIAFLNQARIDLPLFFSMGALSAKASHYVLAVADPSERTRLSALLDEHGMKPAPPMIMPGALISPSAVIGMGSVVGHGVQIGSRCRLGEHNFIMHNVVIGHDTRTGRYVTLCPGVFVSGYVDIDERVIVHANATLAKGIKVGSDVLICQGASCFRSIASGSHAIGNPAKIMQPMKK